MSTFTREAVLLKWNTGDPVERAFAVLREGYHGGDKTKPASYGRSLHDSSLLAVRGTGKRRFTGTLIVYDSPSGSTGGVAWGSIAEAEAAHAATDLQCMSFEDSAYWNAEWMGDWGTLVEYDPKRGMADIAIQLEEK